MRARTRAAESAASGSKADTPISAANGVGTSRSRSNSSRIASSPWSCSRSCAKRSDSLIGAAIACFEEALDFAEHRVLFKRPLTHTQTVQIRLADMARRITSAQLLSLQLGRLKDAGKMQPAQVSVAKWNNVRMALDIARDCRDILGGSGITTEYQAIRHMLNLESVITYEGTETVHQLVIGKELTGVNAFG